MIQPEIVTLAEKKLIGKRMVMSFAGNKTAELWRGFAPGIKEIQNRLNNEKISLQVYPFPVDFSNPHREFVKWAAVEVADFDNIPDGMKTYTVSGGLYAVFHYKGSSSDTRIFEYIFGAWLPGSGYVLDDRPHFEILGEKYNNADPDSEEDICIPIRLKGSPAS